MRGDGNCLGRLRKGSYSSSAFTAFGGSGAKQFKYETRDDFWANALDHAAGYWFQVADDYEQSNGDATLSGVYLFAEPAAALQEYPSCPEQSISSVKTDAASLLRFIKQLRGLKVRDLPPVRTADGEAHGVAITAKPGAPAACYDNETVRTLIASRANALDGYVWGVTGHDRIDAYFEDIGPGHTVAILLYAPNGTFSSSLRTNAAALISTFKFARPS